MRTRTRARSRVIAKMPELMGPTEVAQALNVAPPNIDKIKDLPQPIPRPPAPMIGSRLWLADEIWEFAPIYNARRPRANHDDGVALTQR